MTTENETWEARCARENAERLAKRNSGLARLREIAKAMGFKAGKEYPELEGGYVADSFSLKIENPKSEERLTLAMGEYHSKENSVTVRGDYPRDHDGSYVQLPGDFAASPSINISLAKSNERIAAEIERRFMPAYRPRLAETLRLIASRKAYADAKMKNLLALKREWFGRKDVEATEYEKDNSCFSFDDLPEGYGEVEVSDDSASLKLSNLSIERMKKVLKALKS